VILSPAKRKAAQNNLSGFHATTSCLVRIVVVIVVIFVVSLVVPHALFDLRDSGFHLGDGFVTMTALIMLCLLKVLLGLFESIERGLHVGLVFRHHRQRKNHRHDESQDSG
jgi:hypothetical protein